MTSTRLAIGLVAVVLCSALMISIPNAVQAAPEGQPEMRAAMDHLREAQKNLESASHDKGGHRAKALEHVRQAMAEVQLGIQYDDRH
jgi:hypothetical protein